MFRRITILFMIVGFFGTINTRESAIAADSTFQSSLNSMLTSYIKKQKGTITIQYVDLTTNESYSYNGIRLCLQQAH